MTKYHLIFFGVLISSLTAHAIDTRNESSNSASPCTVRMSNIAIRSSMSFGSGGTTGFCSGTLVAPDIIVTAAHCLNEAVSSRISNLNDLKKGVRLNLAVGTEMSSNVYEVQSGSESTVFSDDLATYRQRERFITQGDITLVSKDFVALKLTTSVPSYNSELCPRLPSAEDCAAFAAFEANEQKDLSTLSSTFYATSYYENGAGASKTRASYPSNRLIYMRARELSKHSKYLHIRVNFGHENNNARLVKGDSGSGLLWKSGDEEFLVGVQSAVETENRSVGVFARSCDLVNHPNWP